MLNTTQFICQLSQDIQSEIKHRLECYFHTEGIVGDEADKIIENAMNDRLVSIEDVIDLDELFEN